MPDPTLVVMAAGIGSRFGGLKQFEPIGPNGETVIAYAVYDALLAGFRKIVFVIREELEAAFRERVGKVVEQRADTAYAFQRLDRLPRGFGLPAGRKKPWGTAHAVLCCKDVVREPFAAINADDFYGRVSYRVLCEYLKNAQDRPGEYDYCMAGFVLRNTLSAHGHVARGICTVSPDGFLEDVVERTRIQEFDGVVRYAGADGRWRDLSAESIVSMNMWGFTPSFFNEVEARFIRFLEENGADPNAEYFIPTVVADLIREEKARVRVLKTDATWLGVTYRDDVGSFRQAIAKMIRQGVYPAPLWP